MTVYYKQGVLGDLQGPMQKCEGRISKLYASKGKRLIVTSKRDGNHGDGSFHYIGCAEDFEQDWVPVSLIDDAAGHGFDVIPYVVNGKDYVHCEHDPKK